MNLTTTMLFYLLIGAAVAVPVHLVADADAAVNRLRWFRTVTAIIFWPLYLPALLQRPTRQTTETKNSGDPSGPRESSVPPPTDKISAAIRQVEAELDLALGSLDGWSDAVLAREQHRFTELRAAWHAQAGKIHELDRLLAQPAFASAFDQPLPDTADLHGPRAANSERVRRENIARLRAIRGRLHDDLLNTLAWVRELVTMIHLAKYTGAPASRAEELVLQIATAVEGLSEVAAWRDESHVVAS